MATASRSGPQPLRLTPQRAAVLAAVRAAGDHPTARDIWRRVRAQQPGIGFATVYRTLALLAEHGQITALQLHDEGACRYDAHPTPHDHVRCTGCGAIVDVPATLPDSARDRAAAASGYVVTGHAVQFSGRCPDCATR